MHLSELSADGFRNLEDVRLEPHRRLNTFLGDNGQGKTNVLEAVHLAAALRPLRPLERASDLVGFHKERGHIRALFELEGPLPVEVIVEPQGRKATLAGKAVRDVAEVASRVGVVAFTPDDLWIVRGAPERRRRALDRFAYGLLPSFAEVARRYEKALEQRNRLLKAPRIDETLLAAYTAPLVDAGVALARLRARAARAWAPAFEEAAHAITDAHIEASLSYACTFADGIDLIDGSEEALKARFYERLERQRDGEQKRRTTLTGPHLDDLLLGLGDRRARHLASQGEARAIVLALKIAAVRLYAEARGTNPLLLLDDVAGELDPHKAACLFRAVDEVEAQAFVTATHEGALPALGEARLFSVRAGKVVERR